MRQPPPTPKTFGCYIHCYPLALCLTVVIAIITIAIWYAMHQCG